MPGQHIDCGVLQKIEGKEIIMSAEKIGKHVTGKSGERKIMTNNTRKLSETMQKAVDYVQKYGGDMVRYPGGFWAREGWPGTSEYLFFLTNTVHGLVTRGASKGKAQREKYPAGRQRTEWWGLDMKLPKQGNSMRSGLARFDAKKTERNT